ncbi:MAG: methylenetetrahydrofolate reductase [NAD(P)H] [Spirochaeta sp. LUC14_002_19_P3]|nr:MAG: methylenetetrahydrofolate reductase [NAD(P)H] [Spirochaeta sp. LUC14_002_19_P3]
MRIKDLLKTGKTAISFEFFPPKTAGGWEKLFGTIAGLVPLNPAFVSVTYGAGGSTREKTHELVARLQQEAQLSVCAHLTCVGHSRGQIREILNQYAAIGVNNILALRGDIPQNTIEGEFRYAADLVRFIRSEQPDMSIGVAGFPEGHPESRSRLDEIDRLKEKTDAGADYIITQLFFDNRDYFDFVSRCELADIKLPIIAGIMPVTSTANITRMAELAPRTRFPASLLRAVNRAAGKEGVEHAGIHWAAEQVRGLLDKDVPGIHLYTLNHSRAVLGILDALGLATPA